MPSSSVAPIPSGIGAPCVLGLLGFRRRITPGFPGETTSVTRRVYAATVGTILAAAAVLFTWNAWRFDWLRGYDAFANDLYATVVGTELRLPSTAETSVWHTPPLWFALASPRIQARAIEASEFVADADRHGVHAVPAIVVDDRYAWAGSVPEGMFVDRVLAAVGD